MNLIEKIIANYVVLLCVVFTIIIGFTYPLIGVLAFIGAVVIVWCDRQFIRVKYFVKDLPPIEKISKGDWIDLRAAEDVDLEPGQYYNIRLGVGMILPRGYEAHVLPRSSTPSKFGIILANSQGVIDNSFSGDGDEWHFPAIALRHTVIRKGDRVCQFRIVKNQPEINFIEVKHLNKVSRGGLGSTGKR